MRTESTESRATHERKTENEAQKRRCAERCRELMIKNRRRCAELSRGEDGKEVEFNKRKENGLKQRWITRQGSGPKRMRLGG